MPKSTKKPGLRKVLLIGAFPVLCSASQINAQHLQILGSSFSSFCDCCDEFSASFKITTPPDLTQLDSIWIHGHAQKIDTVTFLNDSSFLVSLMVPLEWRIKKGKDSNDDYFAISYRLLNENYRYEFPLQRSHFSLQH